MAAQYARRGSCLRFGCVIDPGFRWGGPSGGCVHLPFEVQAASDHAAGRDARVGALQLEILRDVLHLGVGEGCGGGAVQLNGIDVDGHFRRLWARRVPQGVPVGWASNPDAVWSCGSVLRHLPFGTRIPRGLSEAAGQPSSGGSVHKHRSEVFWFKCGRLSNENGQLTGQGEAAGGREMGSVELRSCWQAVVGKSVTGVVFSGA